MIACSGHAIKAVKNKDRNFTRSSLRAFIRAADERLEDYLKRLNEGELAHTVLSVTHYRCGAECQLWVSATAGYADPAIRSFAQLISWPPLAESVEPVMNPASSEARKTTQRATSSGSPVFAREFEAELRSRAPLSE